MFVGFVTPFINIFQLCFANVKKRELGYYINAIFIISCRNYITKANCNSNDIIRNGKKHLVFKDINYRKNFKIINT